MKSSFHLNDYRICMHCDSEEKAEVFLNRLHKVGKKWITGRSYVDAVTGEINTSWGSFKEKTVYYFLEGMNGSLDSAIENNETVLEFDNFYWEELNNGWVGDF